jgi:hypothetical protein
MDPDDPESAGSLMGFKIQRAMDTLLSGLTGAQFAALHLSCRNFFRRV